MARRRRRKSSLVPWIVVLVLVLGAVALWRFLPELKSRFSSGATAPAPAASDTLDVCGFVPSAAVAQALGVDAVEARHLGAGPEVPAEGTCTWNFRRDGKEGRAVALVFTRASLKRGGIDALGHAYYQTIATGLEYTYKEAPLTLHGLGDEAAAAGFAASGVAPAQLVLRRGDSVLNLVLTGVDREAATQLARALAEHLP